MADRSPFPVQIDERTLSFYTHLESLKAHPVCGRCESLLEQLPFRHENISFEDTITELAVDLSQCDQSCDFCDALQNTERYSEFYGANVALPHCARTVRSLYIKGEPQKGTPVRFDTHTNLITQEPSSQYIWPPDPLSIDLTPVKKAIPHCKDHHNDDCGMAPRGRIPGLMVFNCNSRNTEPATEDTVYVALSYVWGPGSGNVQTGDFPETIEDAIAVTKRLGYTYLWVDQICIDQIGNDEQSRAKRHAQICQMDRIYQFADLTIVAMAGNDSSYGLPGVGYRARKRQRRFKSGDFVYIEVMKDPWEVHRDSKWDTRAWTYQEWAFSRRSLAFGDYEAWFSCCLIEGEACRESDSFVLQPDSAHEVSSYLKPLNYGTSSKSPWSIGKEIEIGVRKSISSTGDRLNSLSGILRSFQDQEHPVYHLYGIPILPPYGAWDIWYGTKGVRLERSIMDGFVVGLSWQHDDSKGCRDRRISREKEFPSWSWAGWKEWGQEGETITWHSRLRSRAEWGAPTDVSVSIELRDGSIIPWTRFENDHYFQANPGVVSNFIHVKAWTFDVDLEWSDLFNHLCWAFPSKDSADTADSHRFHFRVSGLISRIPLAEAKRKKLTAVLMGNFDLAFENWSYPFVLIVEEKGQWTERVGHMVGFRTLTGIDEDIKVQYLKERRVRRQVRLG